MVWLNLLLFPGFCPQGTPQGNPDMKKYPRWQRHTTGNLLTKGVTLAFPFLGALWVAVSLEKGSWIPNHGGNSARTLCEGPVTWGADTSS